MGGKPGVEPVELGGPPVKFGLRGGTFHTSGNTPGNRGSAGTARVPTGNGGSRAGSSPEMPDLLPRRR